VLWAVEFDDEFSSKADAVDDVRTNGGLAAELVTVELLGAEVTPEKFFGGGRKVAEFAGAAALLFVAVHRTGVPPPRLLRNWLPHCARAI
jgi:hypothetical protein